jgi:hypothetical protein
MKKSNLLHFRANRREQRSKGRQKGKVYAFPAKTQNTDDMGKVVFQFKGRSFLIGRLPVNQVESVCNFVSQRNTNAS